MAWLRAVHLVFVVTWFAGLFYLPRLFVYHAMTDDAAGSERFKVMERKLFRGIMTPSAILTILLGTALLQTGWDAYRETGWLWTKLIIVALLVGYHMYCGALINAFADDRNTHTHTFYRWFNELPLVFLITIVALAVVKPF